MSAPFTGERLLGPGEGGWEPVAPSAVRFRELCAAAALDKAGSCVVEAFRLAARRALEAGST